MLVLKLKILRTHTYTDGWKERLCPAKFSLSFSFFFFFHLKVKKKSFYRSSKFINTQTTKTAPQPTRRTFFSRPPRISLNQDVQSLCILRDEILIMICNTQKIEAFLPLFCLNYHCFALIKSWHLYLPI